MKLTFEMFHHTLTITAEHEDPDQPEQHDTTLDTLVERSGGADPSAEMDHRGRMGFKP